jgi:branched-chain amino acid transport system substrate-binding protein
MKPLAPVLLVGAALAVAVLASPAAGRQAAPDAARPIIIGVATAQSGWLSPFDGPGVAAAEVRRDEINRRGGLLRRPVKFVYADSKSDINESANAAVKVISQGAQFIILTCGFDLGRPAALVASKKKILVISICASSAKWGTLPPTNYSMTIGSPTEGGAIAQWATEGKTGPHCKTGYVLTDTESEYSGEIGRTYIPRYFTGKIVGQDTFKNSDASFQSQVTRLQSTNPEPDCIFLSSYVPGGASMVRQLRSQGITQPILSIEGMEGDYWLSAVPNLSNFYAISFGSIYGDDPVAKVNQLARAVERKMKKDLPVSTFVNGYSVMETFERAITRAKTTSSAAVKRRIDRFRNEPLLIGPTTFTNTSRQSFGRPVRITQIQNGKASFRELFKPHGIRP